MEKANGILKGLQLRFHSVWDFNRHSVFHVLQHLVVTQSLKWEAPERDDFVKEDPVGPDIRHGCK